MPMGKILEFLDHHLQPHMKQDELFTKDTGDFLEKLKAVGEIPKEVFLVTAFLFFFSLSEYST